MSSIQFVMLSKGACKLPICSYVIVTMGGSAVLGLNYLLIAAVEIKPPASRTKHRPVPETHRPADSGGGQGPYVWLCVRFPLPERVNCLCPSHTRGSNLGEDKDVTLVQLLDLKTSDLQVQKDVLVDTSFVFMRCLCATTNKMSLTILKLWLFERINKTTVFFLSTESIYEFYYLTDNTLFCKACHIKKWQKKIRVWNWDVFKTLWNSQKYCNII